MALPLGIGKVWLLSGAVDPSAGAGVPAPLGSSYLREDGTTYEKIGAADTDWAAQVGARSSLRLYAAFGTSAIPASNYGAFTAVFVPFRPAQTDWFFGQLTVPPSMAGPCSFFSEYAMSAALSGDVELGISYTLARLGASANPAPTVIAAAAFTPGANTDTHEVDSSVIPGWAFDAVAGDTYNFTLARTATDTNLADFRNLAIGIKAL